MTLPQPRTERERRAYREGYEAALEQAGKHGVEMAKEFHRLSTSAEIEVDSPLEVEIRKWELELDLRESKAGPGSKAALYAEGVLKGLRYLR